MDLEIVIKMPNPLRVRIRDKLATHNMLRFRIKIFEGDI